MRLVKTPMTLEQYEAKYPKYQSSLLSFSDAEIKEFNSKFYKNNGNKNIPNKYALLEKYKWVHIKDRYYQVPRVSKLGKAGIGLLAAGVIAAGIVIPIKLLGNNVTLTEEEFKTSLTYFTDISNADRKYRAKGTMTREILGKTTVLDASVEVSGDKIRVSNNNLMNSVSSYDYNLIFENKLFYSSPRSKLESPVWQRTLPKSTNDFVDSSIGSVFEMYISKFNEFVKKGKDTYSVEFDNTEEQRTSHLAADLTFNKDKTLKRAKQTMSTTYSPKDQENNAASKSIKATIDLEFDKLGEYSIPEDEFPVFDKTVGVSMEYDTDKGYYSGNTETLTDDSVETVVTIKDENAKPFNTFYVQGLKTSPGFFENVELDDDVVQSVVDADGNDIDFTIEDNAIKFTSSPITDTNDTVVITLKLKQDYDYGGYFETANNQ